MSHISRLKTQIVEKEFLLQALKDLGYDYEEGDLTVGGFAEHVKVDVKVVLRVSNDIGFRKVGDHYEILADWWGVRGVKEKDFANQVFQRYAYHAARARLEQQGFSLVEEQSKENGQIRLVMRRVA